MNCSTKKLTLAAMAFSAVLACSFSEAQAEIRRGLLYDMFHFGGSGGSCDSCDSYATGAAGYSCCQSVHAWLGGQLEAEKWRIREHVRTRRMHFYLQIQDKKKLLHRECPPFQDCYWGYYPTCWREFPREPYCVNCPPTGSDSMYYDDAGPAEPHLEDWDPEIYDPIPADPEFSDSLPPLPEAAPLSEEAPPEPAPAPYVE